MDLMSTSARRILARPRRIRLWVSLQVSGAGAEWVRAMMEGVQRGRVLWRCWMVGLVSSSPCPRCRVDPQHCTDILPFSLWCCAPEFFGSVGVKESALLLLCFDDSQYHEEDQHCTPGVSRWRGSRYFLYKWSCPLTLPDNWLVEYSSPLLPVTRWL